MISIQELEDIPQKEFEFYTQKYKGAKMVIKVSGGELEKKSLLRLIETVHILLQNDITIFLVFGGGVQIDKFYGKYFSYPRKKISGVGVTTEKILEIAVIPAYNAIIKMFREYFSDISYFLDIVTPHSLQVEPCKECKKFGFVANPYNIIFDESKPLHIIGFLGEDSSGQQYNINADEIAFSITKQEDIEEVIFITGTGGVLDNSGEIISELSDKDLVQILDNTFSNVTVSGGMKKKCQEILELLQLVPKVAIASSSSLQKELFTHSGAGTLCKKL